MHTPLRPDIPLMESGNVKEADKQKEALEENQRKRRTALHKSNAPEHCLPPWAQPSMGSSGGGVGWEWG